MNLLFIGDVVAKPGRQALRKLLPELRTELDIDVVIANGENAAGGAGLTRETARDFFRAGVDAITGGNHLFDKPEGVAYIAGDPRISRPANFHPDTPGHELVVVETPKGRLAVGCVLGRIFMRAVDDPFIAVNRLRDAAREAKADVFILDIHAEASSEKIAMAWYLDGTAALVAGTHTHVPTADERILPQGTAFVTDVGMTGPYDGVIGMDKQPVIEHMVTGMRRRFRPATGDVRLFAVRVEIDPANGTARTITRITRKLEE